MAFNDEVVFEDAVVAALQRNGWGECLNRPTEKELLANWASILFETNRDKDRLGDVPLTETEMGQVMEQIIELRTPLRLNEFINGRTVAIRRDAPQAHNLGKEVGLKIYDRLEIAGGQSRYQIARQPRFAASNEILPPRRGDLMLLINGMPVIHIELKRGGVPVSQAYNQISKYAHEGVFSGLFSLVQVFVAMTPDKTRYFTNPGPDGEFNEDFYFSWADFDNEPVNAWDQVVNQLLSIPMAHQLIGFYTVADRAAGTLMVMRSYQYYAASRIADRVTKKVWGDGEQRGGHVWHTTGSGKTITSFKTAQLIADSKQADKVVFLLDRIELGTQSLANYRSYGGDAIEVEDTPDSHQLLDRLRDDLSRLIVTSIQKMSLLHEGTVKGADLAAIRGKRVVFIVDEAHRSTFGEMLTVIKETLPDALFFGFTGTPIHLENQKKQTTTSLIFGDELHRYSIADGIRDGNVLGFDPEMVETFSSMELRKLVALEKARATSETEALADPAKAEVFTRFMDKKQVPLASTVGADGRRVLGIEDSVPTVQYEQPRHRQAVVDDVTEHWGSLSRNSKFHAILATSSIPEAIEYFRLFRAQHPQLNVTALFDPNIENTAGHVFKSDGLVEILRDYNQLYGRNFSLSNHGEFKKEVSARLAHKGQFSGLGFSPEQRIDLLIVVDQMLTGFDSKWLNTLYLDKVLEFENIIQAFSRTNRIFGPDKPFGSIRYYRRPHTMKAYIDRAVELYSGNRPLGLFVEQLDGHLNRINACFADIEKVFAGVKDFVQLPDGDGDRAEFARLFSELYHELQAALIQGFSWSQDTYKFPEKKTTITVALDEPTYLALLARYKDLTAGNGGGGGGAPEVPFDIDTHITHVDTERIDAEFLNDKFTKYLRAREDNLPSDELEALLEEMHASFARLSAEDQVYANIWLHDIAAGEVQLVEGKTVHDYINDYRSTHQDRQIEQLVRALGVDEDQLRTLLAARVSEITIDEYGRFTRLMGSIDPDRAADYVGHGSPVPPFMVNVQVDNLLRRFVLTEELPEDLEPGMGDQAVQEGQ